MKVLLLLLRSRYNILSHFFDGLNYGLSVGKPKNNGLLRKKNTKGLIIGQKGTRMAEDGQCCNGLEMTILRTIFFFKIHDDVNQNQSCLARARCSSSTSVYFNV